MQSNGNRRVWEYTLAVVRKPGNAFFMGNFTLGGGGELFPDFSTGVCHFGSYHFLPVNCDTSMNFHRKLHRKIPGFRTMVVRWRKHHHFLSPHVHIAWWTYMRRFLSVCHVTKIHWTIIHISKSIVLVIDYTLTEIHVSQWAWYYHRDRWGPLPTSSCIFFLTSLIFVCPHP